VTSETTPLCQEYLQEFFCSDVEEQHHPNQTVGLLLPSPKLYKKDHKESENNSGFELRKKQKMKANTVTSWDFLSL
jgi:hypothetical protein